MAYGSMAATGLGVTLFGVYFGEWWIIGVVLALMLIGALVVRSTKPFRRDGGM